MAINVKQVSDDVTAVKYSCDDNDVVKDSETTIVNVYKSPNLE